MKTFERIAELERTLAASGMGAGKLLSSKLL
jgi:hypothetical protein